jgi:hypothetical protein
MSIEAMKQALAEAQMLVMPVPAKEVTALEIAKAVSDRAVKLCTLLEQAIAEAEKQEPVAWIDRTCLKNLSDDFEPTIGKRPVSEYDIPLYTHPQPKREPVACQHKRYSIDVHEQTGTCYDCGSEGRMRFVVDDTHPQPKREWVGLTDEEEQELDEKYGDDINVYIDQRDLKLKEKNT